jgi:ammonia channel protein AmtB
VSGVYTGTIVPGDEAWMLMSTALVQFMTPGLAFFYGGLVGEGAAISTMMMSFAGAARAKTRASIRTPHAPSSLTVVLSPLSSSCVPRLAAMGIVTVLWALVGFSIAFVRRCVATRSASRIVQR